MNLNFTDCRCVVFLGAVDGLILGIISEMLYGVYYHWEFQRAADYAYNIGSKIAVERGPLILHNRLAIPILYVVSFSVAAYLSQKILGNRRTNLTMFFQITAVSGVTLALTFYFLEDLYREFHYLAQPSARHYLVGLLLTWLISVLIAILVNLFYGAIVNALYKHRFRQRVLSGH
jgi:hypothetical protein